MRRRTLRFSARLAGASTIAIALTLAAAAKAQQTQQAQQGPQAAGGNAIEEIVVTGFRDSLEKAVELKHVDNSQVDSILAEDIGKFPDLNLSESIQRIPGVAISRDGGEGRQISVRGLGPTFTRIRINGMEALSTAGGSDAAGGTNRARSFDFNVFASDLFNAISVRKTADPSTEEGSLGATVDLRTGRPFDYKGFTAVVSAQGDYNTLSSDVSPRAAALLSNTWNDGNLGALASISFTKRQLLDIGTSTVRWATGNAFAPGFASAPAGMTLAQVDAAFHPRFPRFDQYTDDQQRLGATASVQWHPSEDSLLTLDALYADFKGTRQEQYLEAPSFSVGGACTAANKATSCGIADTGVTAGVINSQNTLISGTFNNVDLRVEDRFDRLDTAFQQYSANFDKSFGDSFKVHVLAGHSSSDHENPIQTTVTLDQFNVQGYSYDYSQGRVPLLTYGNAKLTDPTAWVLTGIRERPQSAVNIFDTVKADGELTFNEHFKVEGGFDWKRYSFKTTELRRSNGTTTNLEATIPAALLAIPLTNYTHVVNLNVSGLGAPAGTITSFLAPDLNQASSVLSLYDTSAYNGAFRLGPEPALGNNRSVLEHDTGGYLQGDFRFDVFNDMILRGNFGGRYVHTQQSSKGYSFIGGTPVPIGVEKGYSDFLPAANLVLEPSSQWAVRFSAARAMARADLGNLTPGATISVSGATRTVTAGNPNLQPFLSNDYDLAVEWYPDKGTLVSVALFRKDISSFVQTLSTNLPFTGNPFGIPDSVAVAACGATPGCSTSAQWTFSTPINTPGGPLNGIEISYQQPFSFLPGLLSHTGVLLNGTAVSSKIQYLNSAGAVAAYTRLTNLSPQSYNATVYYEDDVISTRLTAAYRSKYLTRVPGQETGTDVDGTNHTFNLDFSAQYTWNEHLKFTFEAINLTDQFQDQYNDSSNRVSFYHHTGRDFLFGARYTY